MLNYLKLMRFHKPVGIILLWAPTAWALWLAYNGQPPFFIILLFLTGTIIMRGAGCVINDLADKDFDKNVTRTKDRPLANNSISIHSALTLTIILISLAFFILLQLPFICFYFASFALLITIIYPFCKRITQSPQLILGIAFSTSIPMIYATANNINAHSLTIIFYLIIINLLWVLTYDTQYALADKPDDLKLGIKSTAILFGQHVILIIALLQFTFHLFWLILAYTVPLSSYFILFWLAGLAILIYQQKLLTKQEPPKYIQAFTSNGWYGLIMWLGIIIC